MKKIFISLGDISARNYIYEIFREGFEGIEKTGIGDEKLESVGIRTIARVEELSLVGLLEVLPKLRRIREIYKKALKELRNTETLIACDAPGFNLRLIREARRLGVRKIIYFISPQVWAWKPHRAKLIAEYVDELIVILPFEVDFYRRQGFKSLSIHYVGHPLVDIVRPSLREGEFREKIRIGDIFVALLPGSRWGEIKRHLPLLEKLVLHFKDTYFLIPTFENFRSYIGKRLEMDNVRVISENDIDNPSYNAMHYAKFSVIASGTASLEAGLALNPHIVFYRMNPISFWIAKRLVKLEYVSLVNILLGKEVVPEILQANHEKLIKGVNKFRYEENLRSIRKEMQKLRELLGERGVIQRLRELFLELI